MNKCPHCNKRDCVPSVALYNSDVYGSASFKLLCNHCKKPVDLPKEALLEEGFTEAQVAKGIKVHGPNGCDQCNNGYKGRVGLYQVMPISPAIGKLIMEGCTSLDLAEQAQKEGISDLRQSGLKKVLDGHTSLEEVNRVTKE